MIWYKPLTWLNEVIWWLGHYISKVVNTKRQINVEPIYNKMCIMEFGFCLNISTNQLGLKCSVHVLRYEDIISITFTKIELLNIEWKQRSIKENGKVELCQYSNMERQSFKPFKRNKRIFLSTTRSVEYKTRISY